MREYDSIDTMISAQKTKLEQIKQGIKIILSLKNDQRALELFKEKQATVQRIIHKLDLLKKERQKQNSLANAIKMQSTVLSTLEKRIEFADMYLSTNGLLEQDNCSVISELSSIYDRSHTETQTSSTSYEYTPAQEPVDNVQQSAKLIPTNLRLTMLDIDLLTQEEFSSVPKYMLGRLSLETINKFIQVINETVTAKYQILSKPKSALKAHGLQVFKDYKAQETADTKGKTFITELDLAKQQGKKILDKTSYKLLTILRHTKRLYENRSGGTLKYVLILS
ncbi:hypothetical protein CBL_07672 [Carabus blaptoides fortunei]